MSRLFGAQRLVLQAILDVQGDTPTFIEDEKVAQKTQIALRDMRVEMCGLRLTHPGAI